MERITGPFFGHFVAAYTADFDGGSCGIARVFSRRPDTAQADGWLYSVKTTEAHPSEQAALVEAERLAAKVINWQIALTPTS